MYIGGTKAVQAYIPCDYVKIIREDGLIANRVYNYAVRQLLRRNDFSRLSSGEKSMLCQPGHDGAKTRGLVRVNIRLRKMYYDKITLNGWGVSAAIRIATDNLFFRWACEKTPTDYPVHLRGRKKKIQEGSRG